MLSTLATQAWAEEIEEQIDIAQSYLLDNFDQRPTTRIQCCKVIKIQRRINSCEFRQKNDPKRISTSKMEDVPMNKMV
jgi:hypothetical protein